MHAEARLLFQSLIRQSDGQLPLAEAALAIAWEDQGDPAPHAALALLDSYAEAVRPRLRLDQPVASQIATLNRYLFDEQGFAGDPQCYERPDPANSYLDQVLARRTGLPIMLALMYMEVGWRLGLPVAGLALPGHFIVCWRDPGADYYIDPFGGGALWSLADCERQIAAFYSAPTRAQIAWLMRPAARGAILARILQNLKQTHLARNQVRPALAAVERLLLLDAGDLGELRDRGLLRFRAGLIYPALEDLETYARRSPSASDLTQLREFVRSVMEHRAGQN